MVESGSRVAIITGGGSGIGRALGEAVARRGWTVVVADVRRAAAEEAAARITAAGGTATARRVDVADEQQVRALVAGTVRSLGRLDLMVNNAGLAVAGEIDEIDVERWRRVIDVNLWSQVTGSYFAYQVMRDQGHGQIVNVASGLGLLPAARRTAYVTTKYGGVGLSLALRPEAAARGVRVNVICPGPVSTPIFDAAAPRTPSEERRLRRLRRWSITPERAAERYLRGLARDRAVITGSGPVHLLWWLHRLSPTATERLLGDREMRRSRTAPETPADAERATRHPTD